MSQSRRTTRRKINEFSVQFAPENNGLTINYAGSDRSKRTGALLLFFQFSITRILSISQTLESRNGFKLNFNLFLCHLFERVRPSSKKTQLYGLSDRKIIRKRP